jgi:hypothetical protein
MFKKHMTPLHKKGTLDNSPNKGASQRTLPAAATGGGPASFQSYGKATPMAQPAPEPDGLGSGSWSGNPIA